MGGQQCHAEWNLQVQKAISDDVTAVILSEVEVH
jgi:hypothetical protein